MSIINSLMILSIIVGMADISFLTAAAYNKKVAKFLPATIIIFVVCFVTFVGTMIASARTIKNMHQELFLLTHNKDISDVELVKTHDGFLWNGYYLSVTIEGEDEPYTNPSFWGVINTKQSTDGKWHIGTQDEYFSNSDSITFFCPVDPTQPVQYSSN